MGCRLTFNSMGKKFLSISILLQHALVQLLNSYSWSLEDDTCWLWWFVVHSAMVNGPTRMVNNWFQQPVYSSDNKTYCVQSWHFTHKCTKIRILFVLSKFNCYLPIRLSGYFEGGERKGQRARGWGWVLNVTETIGPLGSMDVVNAFHGNLPV